MGNVVLVLARCSNQAKQDFGKYFRMRFEEMVPVQWTLAWSYPMDIQVAGGSTNQGDATLSNIKGAFFTDSNYSGCPYCQATSFFLCHCDAGRVSCWDGHQKSVTCPWCNVTNELSGTIEALNGQMQEEVTGQGEERSIALIDPHSGERGLV